MGETVAPQSDIKVPQGVDFGLPQRSAVGLSRKGKERLQVGGLGVGQLTAKLVGPAADGLPHRSEGTGVGVLRGELPLRMVDEDELDRVVGTLYATVERIFPTIIRIGFASHFAD